MSVASPVRAYTQPLDQQDGSPLLHLPSPMFPERKPGAVLAEGLRMSPKKLPDINLRATKVRSRPLRARRLGTCRSCSKR